MWLLLLAAMILAAPFVLAWSARKTTRRLKFADEAWGSLEYHARQLLEDRTLDPKAGDIVEAIVNSAGDGVLTNAALLVIARAQKTRKTAEGDGVSATIDALSGGQLFHFNRFLVDAILYDSLRSGWRGALFRRVVYWLVDTAKDEAVPINNKQIEPIAKAASRVLEPAHC